MDDHARQSQRLILVDDEPVILELLRTIFSDAPYTVTACKNGNEAIDAMNRGGVDVLLTDKNLPDVGGLDLVKHAKSVQEDSEALILTGYASLDTALQAMELDVFDYIVKPPKDVFDIKRKVQQAFGKQAVIRENKRLMAHLKDKNEELERTLAQVTGIGTLAAGVAHEISSPLFGVMGLAEAIQEEEDLELVRQYAGDIVEYSGVIKDIVVDLTGYSRTSEAEYLTTVDLAQVIQDAARLVTRSTEANSDQIRVEVDEDLFLNARTNEVQQVFVNLIKNAVEAMVEAERPIEVVVRGSVTGKALTVSVTDKGPGIPEERLAVIFDPFYTTKPPGKGTGLGLNIVYRIVTKYSGSISAQSVQGEGTTFSLRFPVADRD